MSESDITSEEKSTTIRLHEGELNVMELLWSNNELAAKDIAKIIKEYIGWEKNTTYTVIKRLIKKGAISRQDPGFLCKALISKKEIQEIECNDLIQKLFNGSMESFIDDYLKYQDFTKEELASLSSIMKANRRILY
ncbi:MAG: BlaI/MecI/CopY family transcriptional regulator [Clostridiales bacterium]|nr:BlaI/MecI/CopY family transcriptional regulator [Clostridiales bacterium]